MNKPDPRAFDAREKLGWQEVSLDVLREKYAKGAERDLDGPAMAHAVRARVARALAAVETHPALWEPRFLEALEAGFIPGGRINSAAGAGIDQVTLINCFVQPVGDSISETVDGKPGIYIALREAAEIQANFFRTQFELGVKQTRKVSEMAVESTKEVFEPITTGFSEMLEKTGLRKAA